MDPASLSLGTLPNNNVSALEVFSPAKVLESLLAKENCTEELVEVIKTTQPLQLKKLANIFLKVQNFDIEKIIELTVSRIRVHRFNSTYLILTLIKSSYLSSRALETVEALFQSVFIVRLRDIDPHIRATCIQFLCEWMLSSAALRSLEYLKFIGWSLNDKSDSVRRRALRSILQLSKFCRLGRTESEAVIKFVLKYKARLIEIARLDVNPNIQKEGIRTVLSIFAKNTDLFTSEEILAVMCSDETPSGLKNIALKKICPEGIWDLDSLHSALLQSHPSIFVNFRLSDSEIDSFVLNITEFVRNHSSCCDKEYICLLDILAYLKFNRDPSIFFDLLESVKDNPLNIKAVITALCNVCSFPSFPASTFKLLDYLRKLISDQRTSPAVVEFVRLLKQLEDSYSLQVETIVTEIRDLYLYPLIRSFDLSNYVTDKSSTIVKCYAALWRVHMEDYEWIKQLHFETNNVDQDPDIKLEIIDFALFLHSNVAETASEPVDPSTAARFLFDKITSIIPPDFNKDSATRLFQLISIGKFTHCANQLFVHCSEDQLLAFAESIKDPLALLLGYFEFLENEGCSMYLKVAKKLAGRMKNEKERRLLGPLKHLVHRADVLDDVLLNFVPCLTVNECIVLENLAAKSKFKTQLLRRCKTNKEIRENVTFI